MLVACGPGQRAKTDGGDPPEAGPTCQGQKTCSADLRNVLCDGAVFETCAPEMGCANDTCVAACQAAAATESSIGCDFYAVAPDVIDEGRGLCFAAFVANTWDIPALITVERDGQTLPLARIARVPQGQGPSLTYAPLPDDLLAPNQTAILFLAGVDCFPGADPFSPVDAAVHGTGHGKAYRIRTTAPVIAYDMYPYNGGTLAATSATLLLPTSAWGLNYVGVNAFRKSVQAPDGEPFMALVGATDDTTVTIRPTAAIAGGPGVPPAAQDVPTTFTLGRGQVLQLTQPTELSGSVIQSDKPIGLWGGATCLSIDIGDGACDSAHQQIPPVKTLGHRYAAVRYRDRFAGQEESVPWRIFGAVDGTLLTYSPSTPPGAPTMLTRGEVAEFWAPGPFTIQSQNELHPFYISAHMTGCGRVSPPHMPPAPFDCRGDPEFINVIPLDQYLPRYMFFTDPTYPETNLVLVREKKNGQFAEVTLDCVGTITGWRPIDAAGDVEYAHLDLVTGNFSPVGNCNNGLHFASSAQPFGLVVWGWGSAATTVRTTTNSYAYPAGGGLRPINPVVIE